MKVLTLTEFSASNQRVRISFEDESGLLVAEFIVDSCYNFRSEFHQTFKAALEVHVRGEPRNSYPDTLWQVWQDRTLTPVEDLHAGLREFVLFSLPDLMMVGYTVTGSYEYEDEIWHINPPQTIETVALPDLDF